VVLAPILSGPPPPVGSFPTDHTDIDAHLAKMEAMAPNAALANLAGLPALAIPAGMAEGLPVGVQLIGPPQSDRALLSLAAKIAPELPPVPYPYAIAGLPG
jgi:amidase